MGKPVTNEQLRQVWEAFQNHHSVDPGLIPETFIQEDGIELERIVVSKGVLHIGLETDYLETEIIKPLQYKGEEWETHAKEFVGEFCKALGISHGKGVLLEYLLAEGFVGYGNGITLVFNPLSSGVGEADEFKDSSNQLH